MSDDDLKHCRKSGAFCVPICLGCIAPRINQSVAGISDDAIEMAARLVERLGALPNMHSLSVPQFAALAAADIRLLKHDTGRPGR